MPSCPGSSCSIGSRSVGRLLVTEGKRAVLIGLQRQGCDRQTWRVSKGSKGRYVTGRMGGAQKAAKAGI